MNPTRRHPLLSLGLLGLLALHTAASAHVTLEQPQAPAGSTVKAALRVGHGCGQGEATHTLSVQIPPGFRGAKPMPKAGWAITIRRAPLAQPYDDHGRRVADEVTEITWAARTRDDWLAESQYDEFIVRGQTPAQPGPLWFKVAQICEHGRWDWAEVPASGTSTQGLKALAALLDVTPAAAAAAHQH
jgi:uncharacterized protein YcnI